MCSKKGFEAVSKKIRSHGLPTTATVDTYCFNQSEVLLDCRFRNKVWSAKFSSLVEPPCDKVQFPTIITSISSKTVSAKRHMCFGLRHQACGRTGTGSWAQVRDWKYCQCWTFQSNETQRISLAGNGRTSKLELKLDAKADEFWPGSSDSAGFRVIIHPRGTPPNTESGVSIATGAHAELQVARRHFTRLKSPFSDGCESSSVSASVRKVNAPQCMRVKMAEKIAVDCKCYDVNTEHFVNYAASVGEPGPAHKSVRGELLECGTFGTNMTCWVAVHNDFTETFNPVGNCTIPCSEEDFDVRVSTIKWPSGNAVYKESDLEDGLSLNFWRNKFNSWQDVCRRNIGGAVNTRRARRHDQRAAEWRRVRDWGRRSDAANRSRHEPNRARRPGQRTRRLRPPPQRGTDTDVDPVLMITKSKRSSRTRRSALRPAGNVTAGGRERRTTLFSVVAGECVLLSGGKCVASPDFLSHNHYPPSASLSEPESCEIDPPSDGNTKMYLHLLDTEPTFDQLHVNEFAYSGRVEYPTAPGNRLYGLEPQDEPTSTEKAPIIWDPDYDDTGPYVGFMICTYPADDKSSLVAGEANFCLVPGSGELGAKCCNKHCVHLDDADNGINDCGDNSDEGSKCGFQAYSGGSNGVTTENTYDGNYDYDYDYEDGDPDLYFKDYEDDPYAENSLSLKEKAKLERVIASKSAEELREIIGSTMLKVDVYFQHMDTEVYSVMFGSKFECKGIRWGRGAANRHKALV